MADRVVAQRTEVYQRAKARNPNRWSGEIRNRDLADEVHLNLTRNSAKVEGVKQDERDNLFDNYGYKVITGYMNTISNR